MLQVKINSEGHPTISADIISNSDDINSWGYYIYKLYNKANLIRINKFIADANYVIIREYAFSWIVADGRVFPVETFHRAR